MRQATPVVAAMWRHRAVAADLRAIPVDLVDIGDNAYGQSEVELVARARGEVDVTPVPGVSGVSEVLLRAPRLVGLDALPLGVVEGRGGPGGVVTGVELPRAVEHHGGFAKVFDGEVLLCGRDRCASEERCKEEQYQNGCSFSPQQMPPSR